MFFLVLVNRFVNEGASHIKVYYRLPLELIRVASAAAHERGVPVTAHLELVDADQAIRAGVDGIEHVTSFGTAVAVPGDAERFRAAVAHDNDARRRGRYELWSKLDLQESPRVKSVMDLVVARKIFVSPTQALLVPLAYAVRSQLFGTSPLDALALGCGALILLLAALGAAAHPAPATLVKLDGIAGLEYRVGFPNFRAITRYNRSQLYASAVSDLADAIEAATGAREMHFSPGGWSITITPPQP